MVRKIQDLSTNTFESPNTSVTIEMCLALIANHGLNDRPSYPSELKQKLDEASSAYNASLHKEQVRQTLKESKKLFSKLSKMASELHAQIRSMGYPNSHLMSKESVSESTRFTRENFDELKTLLSRFEMSANITAKELPKEASGRRKNVAAHTLFRKLKDVFAESKPVTRAGLESFVMDYLEYIDFYKGIDAPTKLQRVRDNLKSHL
ncbi:hypothetical protein N8275_01090 [Pseudomonadales bacterium]|nr:hypothetical protein [Pseudomonadales bacterium]